jgi:general secretion pathway protein I
MNQRFPLFGARLCEPQHIPLAFGARLDGPQHVPLANLSAAGRRLALLECRAGFSLIEVMVAILILAIALTGLTAGITTALGSSKESELQTTAALFAAGQIELLRAQTDWTDGTDQGDCGAGLPLYRWQQTISPTDTDGLHEVDVVVQNAQTGGSIYELKTMLFQIPADASSKGKSGKSKDNRT